MSTKMLAWARQALLALVCANLLPVAPVAAQRVPTLQAATAPMGVELLPCVQGGLTKSCTVNQIRGFVTPTIADLKALPCIEAVRGTVSGYNAAADGGGGEFACSPTSIAADDGQNVFTSTASATGRWLRVKPARTFAEAGGRSDQANTKAVLDRYVANAYATGADLDFSCGGCVYTFGFTSYTLPNPIGVRGDARLRNVTWVLGIDGQKQDWHENWSGVTVEMTTRTPGAGVMGVQLAAVRDFSFTETARFTGMNIAIGGSATASGQFHAVTGITIRSKFYGVDYAVRWLQNGVATLVASDFAVSGVYANPVFVTAVDMDSVDGVTLTGGNQIFEVRPVDTAAATASTNASIYHIIRSPIVTIDEGNHLFEAGEEAILLEDCSVVSISDPMIVNAGELKPRPGIRISNPNVYLDLSIKGASIQNSSRNLLEVVTGQGGSGTISGVKGQVDLRKGVVSATQTYFGDLIGNGAMPTTQYGVSVTGWSFGRAEPSNGGFTDTGGTTIRLNDYVPNIAYAAGFPVRYAGTMQKYASAAIPASTATPIFPLYSMFNNQVSVDGTVAIVAKNSDADTGGSLKSATYYLLVHIGSDGRSVSQVGAVGATGGATTDAPSFTWTIDSGNRLVATPVSSVAGTFHFYATTAGNVKLGRS